MHGKFFLQRDTVSVGTIVFHKLPFRSLSLCIMYCIGTQRLIVDKILFVCLLTLYCVHAFC